MLKAAAYISGWNYQPEEIGKARGRHYEGKTESSCFQEVTVERCEKESDTPADAIGAGDDGYYILLYTYAGRNNSI